MCAKMRALFVKNKLCFARAEQLWFPCVSCTIVHRQTDRQSDRQSDREKTDGRRHHLNPPAD